MSRESSDTALTRAISSMELVLVIALSALTCLFALWAAGAGGGVVSADGRRFALILAGIALPPVCVIVALLARAGRCSPMLARAVAAVTFVVLVAVAIAVAAEEL